MAPLGDFSMIRLLITGGVLYNIKVTSQNQLEIAVDRKVNTPLKEKRKVPQEQAH